MISELTVRFYGLNMAEEVEEESFAEIHGGSVPRVEEHVQVCQHENIGDSTRWLRGFVVQVTWCFFTSETIAEVIVRPDID